MKKSSRSEGIPSSISWGDRLATSGEDISNLFGEYFSYVYRKPLCTNLYLDLSANSIVTDLVITTDDLHTAINNTKDSPSYGPDLVPSVLVKRCTSAFVEPLLELFNQSLPSGIFLSAWKSTLIYLLLKSGVKYLVTNYRPISILSVIPKLFDYIVTCKLTDKLIGLVS